MINFLNYSWSAGYKKDMKIIQDPIVSKIAKNNIAQIRKIVLFELLGEVVKSGSFLSFFRYLLTKY